MSAAGVDGQRAAQSLRSGDRPRRLGAMVLALGVVVWVTVSVGAAQASAAVVGAAPTYPIPADAPGGPPSIPMLPAAGDSPPAADQIADPVTPGAVCGDWHLQHSYGDRWPSNSTWWEYQCTGSQVQDVPPPCSGGGGACTAVCYGYPFDSYTVETDRSDYFYWDGADAVFYGELESVSVDDYCSGYAGPSSLDWWDAPTPGWYNLGQFALSVSRQGSGFGLVSSTPSGIACGGGCQASYDSGTVVTLTATPDPYSVFASWSGDCSGTGPCQVTMNQTRSVTATFAPKAFALSVAKAGSGSGGVSSNPAGIGCGSGCQASFAAGSTVTLTATPDAGSVFVGWSGDCSGTGSCQVTMSQARSVTATFAPNLPPHASFTLTCTSLLCKFDASGSTDPDDQIASYAWNFGDATPPGSAQTTSHSYPKAGGYTATLTVTDNAGATDVTSKTFNPISVSARGYKRNGAQKVDLSWNGASGTSFDVYRNATRIAGLQGLSYTDTVTGSGSFTYKICVSGNSVCSNTASVSF